MPSNVFREINEANEVLGDPRNGKSMTNMERTGNMRTSLKLRNNVTSSKVVEVSGVELLVIGRRVLRHGRGWRVFGLLRIVVRFPEGWRKVCHDSEDRITMLNCICHSMMPHRHTNRCWL